MKSHFRGLMLPTLALAVGSAQAGNYNDYTQVYDVDSSTVALYHMDGSAADAVGYHDGTPFGNAGYASGKFGQGLALDGNGDYIRLGNIHQSPPRPYDAGTVEMWFNLAWAPSSFVLSGSGTEFGNNWDDGWFLGRHGGYQSTLSFMVWNSGWWAVETGVTPESLVGEWHHVAGTWGARGLEVWLDGVLMGSQPTWTFSPNNPNYMTALIGTDSWMWATPGMIDEVRISDIQRSPVPEPASLLALGGAAMALVARRKRR